MSKNKHYENDVIVKGGVYTGYSAYDKSGECLTGPYAYDTQDEANYAAQQNIKETDN